MRRVGHKGADLIAPGNTPASFDAAVEAGVDMLEFDVLPENLDGTGELWLAHDYVDLRARQARGTALTLAEGLDHLCATGLDLDVDLKLPGYEDRVAAELRERDVVGRVLVSTMEPDSLRRMREIAPEIRLGWSVPRLRRNPLDSKLLIVPALGALQVLRRVMPGRAARAIRAGRVEAIMANHYLVTKGLVRAVLDAGGELYVWTVDDGDRIARLERMGVTGVISNDPRLFQPLITQVAAE
ncbi:MAG TPA: glycerophosphodiester phosphodiesterase [Solirubrobacteraceae bacterium]|nr:glycerophosphodiester phosphodiesterase [Solirubrobacteraceae bacterium]